MAREPSQIYEGPRVLSHYGGPREWDIAHHDWSLTSWSPQIHFYWLALIVQEISIDATRGNDYSLLLSLSEF